MNIDDILFWSENLPELDNSLEMKKAIGTALIGISVMDDPGEAIETVCEAILKKFRENILPTSEFIKHPANRVSAFGSDTDWLAAYMRYLVKKADNTIAVNQEIDKGLASSVEIVDADDPGTCRGCIGHNNHVLKLSDVEYDDIPPFHIGCRCSMLFLK